MVHLGMWVRTSRKAAKPGLEMSAQRGGGGHCRTDFGWYEGKIGGLHGEKKMVNEDLSGRRTGLTCNHKSEYDAREIWTIN